MGHQHQGHAAEHGVVFSKSLAEELRDLFGRFASTPTDLSIGLSKIALGVLSPSTADEDNDAMRQQSLSLDFPAFLALMSEMFKTNFGNCREIANDRVAREREEKQKHEALLRKVREEKE